MLQNKFDLDIKSSSLGAQYAYVPFWTGFTSRTPLGDAGFEWMPLKDLEVMFYQLRDSVPTVDISKLRRRHPMGGCSPVIFSDTNSEVPSNQITTLHGANIAHLVNKINEQMNYLHFVSDNSLVKKFLNPSDYKNKYGVDIDNHVLLENGFPQLQIEQSHSMNARTFSDWMSYVSLDDIIKFTPPHFVGLMEEIKLGRLPSLFSETDNMSRFAMKYYGNDYLFPQVEVDSLNKLILKIPSWNKMMNVHADKKIFNGLNPYDDFISLLRNCKKISDAMSTETHYIDIIHDRDIRHVDKSTSTSLLYQDSQEVASMIEAKSSKYWNRIEARKYFDMTSRLSRTTSHRNSNITYKEELDFLPCVAHLKFPKQINNETMSFEHPFSVSHTNLLKMLEQQGCILNAEQRKEILCNDDKILHELFHVLHYDEEAKSYICSATGLNAPVLSPLESSLSKKYGINPISEATSFETQGILYVIPLYMLDNETATGTQLSFGDHILVTGKNDGLLYYTEKGNRLLSPMRAVHGANGVYDIIINANSFSRQKIQLVGIHKEDSETIKIPLRQLIALAIGANRVTSTYTVSGTDEISNRPELPNWIDTWKDNRGFFTLALQGHSNVDRSDLLHCTKCNARVIVYLGRHTTNTSGRCPSCHEEDGIEFSHLKIKKKGDK
tara:strand:+ start:2022 stop:4019 length:1998 start_codon:yes stop_codon:yes gene_type:complete